MLNKQLKDDHNVRDALGRIITYFFPVLLFGRACLTLNFHYTKRKHLLSFPLYHNEGKIWTESFA